ncbi:hypothetical protein OESDEN_11487 [Oesophagostomum dentatum]|uniref:Tc1-like transposase DDE domain-containing protein n=1 Tax=Oesophagostomum dentatum TaxID=61180 RepID=A0A0B1SYZ5_OESDE|nr:hypothetical protein OESDEN_11487 [Oesophagostomum dentatum]
MPLMDDCPEESRPIGVSKRVGESSASISGGTANRSLCFQQDNATIHVSNATKSWLRRYDINTLDWPACSPDLNPIENLWGIILRRIYANNRQFNTVNELKDAISRARMELDVTVLQNVIGNMRRRLFEVGTRHSESVDN